MNSVVDDGRDGALRENFVLHEIIPYVVYSPFPVMISTSLYIWSMEETTLLLMGNSPAMYAIYK